MARIKRHRNARSHQRTKPRSRKPNIPELIYKFLVDDAARALPTKCHCYSRENTGYDEVVDSADTSRIAGRNMGHRTRNDRSRVSKTRGVKRRPISRDLPVSYLQRCVGREGTRKARKYIKKALDFAVESGYLIPSDSTHQVLHVSSNLMKNDPRTSRINTCDRAQSKEHDSKDIPAKLEDLQVQEQRRRGRRRGRRVRRRSRTVSRRRRRRRSRDGRRRDGRRRRGRGRRRSRRSRSRSRSRVRSRYDSPQNPEEVAENDDYEMDENDRKSNIHTDDIEREPKTARSNQPDEPAAGQSTKKAEEENGSDLSVDEDESDDEEEKKKIDITKS